VCIVAPDAGAIKRAKAFQQHFEFHGYENEIGLALMHKERKQANVVDSVTVIGDVKGKTCILVDDMSDTSGTLCKAASELKEKGASKVYAFVTHGIFSHPAADRIRNSDLEAVVCTDSIIQDKATEAAMGGKLKYASVDLLVAEMIRRQALGEETSSLFSVPIYK